MPTWLINSSEGDLEGGGLTRFMPAIGNGYTQAVENHLQTMARDSYTWSKLYWRVTVNPLSGATTLRSRRNGVSMAMLVTAPALTTGVFEDNVNSVALVDGDRFNYRMATGADAGNSIEWTIVSSLLTSASNVPILALSFAGPTQALGLTRYTAISGPPVGSATETYCQYRFRVAATLANLRVWVDANSLDGASNTRSRINGASGNLNAAIGAGATGAFEDAVNTDAVALAALVNMAIITGGTLGSLTWTHLGLKSTSLGRQTTAANANLDIVGFGVTGYAPIEGSLFPSGYSVEANMQGAARDALAMGNMFVRVGSNTLDGATTVRFRKNAANGTPNISVGAGLTGVSEDLVNSENLVAADLINWRVAAGGTAGSIGLSYSGIQSPWAASVAPFRGGLVHRLVAQGVV